MYDLSAHRRKYDEGTLAMSSSIMAGSNGGCSGIVATGGADSVVKLI